MRKYIKLSFAAALLLFVAMFINACDSTSTDDPVSPAATKGSMFVSSSPAGAQIWINGSNSGKVTPDSVTNLDPATYNVTLKLANYKEATFQVAVAAGYQSKPETYTLVSDLDLVTYGPVTIYETIGTTAAQPSGLNLRNGSRGFSTSTTEKDSVDMYYSSTGFLIQSASLGSNMTRNTYFKLPSASGVSNLFDGASSPAFVNTWGNAIADRDSTTYYFVYDNDGHYSKLKVVGYGGGTTGNPAWVQVKWIYNRKAGDVRFQ
jgi:hypothetical protein